MPIRYLPNGVAEELDPDGNVLQTWVAGSGTPVPLGADAPRTPEPKKAAPKKKG